LAMCRDLTLPLAPALVVRCAGRPWQVLEEKRLLEEKWLGVNRH